MGAVTIVLPSGVTADLDDLVAVLATAGAMHVANMANEPGDDDQLDIKVGGLVFEALRWTPGADGQIVTGLCAVLGFRVLAGTSPTLDLYDGTSTSGIPIFKGAGTLTVGQFYPIIGGAGGAPGAAVRCVGGLYGDQGGTSPDFVFFVARTQP